MKKKITFLERKLPSGCWSVALMLCLGLSAVLPGETCAHGTSPATGKTLAKAYTYKLVRSTINASVNERTVSGKVTEGTGKEGLVWLPVGECQDGWVGGELSQPGRPPPPIR